MKKRRAYILIIFILIIALAPSVYGQEKGGNVYIIPIKGEIGPAVYQYVNHNLSIVANDPTAVGIIFEIDTYGGRIDSAEQISQLILNTKVPTISFVNTKAESAGVLLTISADYIAMAPGSTIGSAEPIPNDEKILSMWTSLLRTVAQEKGRDAQIVSAMADRSISIPGVVEEGKLLNLTTQEARNLNFTDIVAKDYDEILRDISISYQKIIRGEITTVLGLTQFASSAYVAPLLLAIGFIGMLVEIFTPGFGLGGTVSLISFALYFGGNVLAGNASWIAVIIFVVGILLLIIEAFVPGFGVPGIGGILCIMISIIFASGSIVSALISLLISFILTIIALVVILKFAPKSKHFDRIVLGTQLKKEDGYTSVTNYEQYKGKRGIVVTALRPAGTISVDEELLDVVSEGHFIETGSSVQIIRVEGRKIIVRKID